MCDCVYVVNGTTGESLSLTIEERKKLASEWIKVSAGRSVIGFVFVVVMVVVVMVMVGGGGGCCGGCGGGW